MATINKFAQYQRKAVVTAPLASKKEVSVVLPTEKSISKISMTEYRYILYGERGIGKSTLADKIFGGNALFCMFEPDEDLEVFKVQIQSWEQFEAVVEKVVNNPNEYSGVVVDNGQVAYEMAMLYAGQQGGFEHPGGMDDYGASWDKVKKAFKRPFTQLISSDKGLIVVCHSQQKEIVSYTGRKYMRIMPDWSGQAEQYLGAFVNNIFYYHYIGENRYLTLEGDDLVEAKVKMSKHFFTTQGQRIARIPMGETLDKGYNNFVSAFNNKQANTFAHVIDKEGEKFKTKPALPSEPVAASPVRKIQLAKR